MTEDAAESAYDKGLRIRKDVLGEAYVDRAMAAADDFNRDFQRLVTSFCWGESWGREDGPDPSPLSRRDRSLMNLVMLGCLNRGEEFKLHVKGALTNGVTRAEIRDALIHLTVYAGVPAGVEAFRLARQAFAEVDQA
ncbi:MAG: 4-carboxymuconolactone decarboxylase [Rhodobacteraceae bacterium PARR1]|nr:MAG: 4-carboxymuconolactone decarboxylase [Rhodobacteraceae bacterium PARR1]